MFGIHAYREAARAVVSFLHGMDIQGFDAFRPAHFELATQLAEPSPGVAAERRRKAERAAEEETAMARATAAAAMATSVATATARRLERRCSGAPPAP